MSRLAATRSPLLEMLDAQGFVVLDGGLATALEASGHELGTELWSAALLMDAPEAVRSVHEAYLLAGADCISTASYQASLPALARRGIDPAAGEALLWRSVELAAEARDAFWAVPAHRLGRLEPLVAASIGPYGAYLADGSEYDGRYDVGRRELAAFHRSRLEIFAATRADVLALETLPSLPEARVLVSLLGELDHRGAWVSFSCRDGARLWDGSPVEEAVRVCTAEAGVVAVGVNCTAPVHVAGLLRRMREATDLAILAYPNSGETYDPDTGTWWGSAAGAEWLERVDEWTRAGARIVGGCCRVGPDVIRALRPRLERTLGGGRGRVVGEEKGNAI
jgi:homocysteine S-methyltransferase